MATNAPATGSPAGGTEAAIADLVNHIALTYPGAENAILAALVIETMAHFLAQQSGADSLAAALNQRLAALPGEGVWQIGQIPRGALNNIQRAIAEGLAGVQTGTEAGRKVNYRQ